MATLAEAVDAAETDWLVSASIPDSVDYLTVGSEVVQVTATFPAQYQARDGSTSEPRIRVVRAAGGTTAASHADGTALTPLIPPSSGPGGAAEAGTVVVTPPLQVDVAAALEGANAPDGGNPLATLADIATLGPVQVVERHITAAEVLTLFSAPTELAPAVPGKLYWPIQALVGITPGITPYLAGAQTLNIGLGEDGHAQRPLCLIEGSGFLQEPTDKLTAVLFAPQASPVLYNAYSVNTPMWLAVDVEDPTAGDGTLDVIVVYRLFTAAP